MDGAISRLRKLLQSREVNLSVQKYYPGADQATQSFANLITAETISFDITAIVDHLENVLFQVHHQGIGLRDNLRQLCHGLPKDQIDKFYILIDQATARVVGTATVNALLHNINRSKHKDLILAEIERRAEMPPLSSSDIFTDSEIPFSLGSAICDKDDSIVLESLKKMRETQQS